MITAEVLKARREQLIKQHGEMSQGLVAIVGAVQMIDLLLAEEDKASPAQPEADQGKVVDFPAQEA